MSKVNIKSAYRIIPVHPLDCHLLGMFWVFTLRRVYYPDQYIFPCVHTNPKVVFSQIKCLKTDLFRQGHTLRLGDSGNCAVRALMRYLHAWGSDPGPLFRHQNGLPLTRLTLAHWLRNAVSWAGVEGNFFRS